MSLRVLVGAFAAAAALSIASVHSTAAELAISKPAPDFTAKDSEGRDVKLSSFKGRIVVLEWTNEGCPYVRKHYGGGNMQATQKAAADKGAVWLTVQSSAPGTQGHVNGLEAAKWMADNKAKPTHFILDPDGKLGHLYDAKTTPHMYVIDKAGVLAYMGAIDDKPTANIADLKGARNYVTEALDAVAAGQPVKTATTRAYGCSVKYATPKS